MFSELGKALSRLQHLRQLQFAVTVDSSRALQLTKQLLSQLSKSTLESEAAEDLTATRESSGQASVESKVADLTATREATVKSNKGVKEAEADSSTETDKTKVKEEL